MGQTIVFIKLQQNKLFMAKWRLILFFYEYCTVIGKVTVMHILSTNVIWELSLETEILQVFSLSTDMNLFIGCTFKLGNHNSKQYFLVSYWYICGEKCLFLNDLECNFCSWMKKKEGFLVWNKVLVVENKRKILWLSLLFVI